VNYTITPYYFGIIFAALKMASYYIILLDSLSLSRVVGGPLKSHNMLMMPIHWEGVHQRVKGRKKASDQPFAEQVIGERDKKVTWLVLFGGGEFSAMLIQWPTLTYHQIS
jgi:hypothetical protein